MIIGLDAPLEPKNRLSNFDSLGNKKIKKFNSPSKKATTLVEPENPHAILRANEAKSIKIERI